MDNAVPAWGRTRKAIRIAALARFTVSKAILAHAITSGILCSVNFNPMLATNNALCISLVASLCGSGHWRHAYRKSEKRINGETLCFQHDILPLRSSIRAKLIYVPGDCLRSWSTNAKSLTHVKCRHGQWVRDVMLSPLKIQPSVTSSQSLMTCEVGRPRGGGGVANLPSCCQPSITVAFLIVF